MSDTPQTDNIPKFYFGDNRPSMETECVSANFARSLERQRNELLDALEKVWPFLEEDDGFGYNAPAYQEAINAARKAIAKAKNPLP